MKRLIYFSAGLLLMAGALFVLFRPESPRVLPPPAREVEVEVTPAPGIEDVGREEVATETPAESGPLAIGGRVVDSGLRPVAGAELILGDETAGSGEDGVFRFEPRVRTRSASLACRVGETVVADWEVVAGSEARQKEPMDETASSAFKSAPLDLDWIRWSLTLSRPPDPTEGLWIHADAVLVEEWGNGGRVQVIGRTNLPDSAHIAGSVYFDEMRSFSSFDPGEVSDGAFRVILWGVAGHRLFSGSYTLKLTFNEVFELPSVVETWQRDRPEITRWALTAEQPIFVGSEAQARSEDRAAQEYYRQVRDAILLLKTMLTTRVREAQRLGRQWDPQLLRDRVEARHGWFHEETVTEDGRLAEAVWRDFLDRRWRPEVRARLERHLERGPQKYREAEGRVQAILGDLLRESYVYSRFVVYRAFGLPGHPNDFYQDESEAGDLTLLELRIRKNLSGLERFCRLAEDAELRREMGDSDE